MRGFKSIFAFTFQQHIRNGKYKRLTISLAVLFFMLPIVIMGAVEIFRQETPAKPIEDSHIGIVAVVDNSQTHLVHFNKLTPYFPEQHPEYEDVETALQEATPNTLILVIDENEEGQYTLTYLLPDETEITEEEAWNYQYVFDMTARGMIAAERNPVWQADRYMEAWMEGYQEEIAEETGLSEEEKLADAREIFGMILPYVNVMLLYFLVLFYGQGVANSVVMEKASKLMDTFLVSVKPEAMIFGKVFAIAISGMMQFAIWIIAVAAGFAGGTWLVKAVNPDTPMVIIKLFGAMAEMSGVFSVSGILLGLLMVFGGFILYCALASIGGAIAGKAEDLASTNMLFTLALVVSFLCTLYAGGLEGMSSSAPWLNWVPFTSILITPSRILLGIVEPLPGLASMLIVYAAAVLVMWLAARVYKIMSLYSGKLPSMKQVFLMVKGR